MSETAPLHSPPGFIDAESRAARPGRGLPERIALIASVPSTLRAFYQPLVNSLVAHQINLTVVASPGPELEELARTGHIHAFPVPISRNIAPWRDLRSLFTLTRALRRGRFHLVHTHTPKAGMLGMIAAFLTRVPRRVHTLHGLPLETSRGLSRRILLWADRLTCRLAHVVCVVSHSLYARALELRLAPPGKLTILGDGSACGVDLNRFQRTPQVEQESAKIRQSFHIPPSADVIGFVGWMVADKGVPALVEMFERVAQTRHNVHLLMIGPDTGPRDPLPAKAWRSIREHPRIHYPGLVNDPVPYYAAMDVLVLPTRREGFPYALLEAAAMSVPVVATRVTGCVDAVMDGRTGFLVPLHDIPAMQKAVERLLNDKTLREHMGRAARSDVEQRFDSRRLVAAHWDLYERLPNSGPVRWLMDDGTSNRWLSSSSPSES